MASAPLLITIPAHSKPASVPTALETRLTATPEKTPEQLANDLAKQAARSESLRQAYLDAVKDRAARESQRAADAASRKLRMHGIHVDKVQRRLDAAAVKCAARREALEAKRQEDKERRAGLALAVMEARKERVAKQEARMMELKAAEIKAAEVHAKSVAGIAEKSKAAVAHAVAVASAQKEKERTVAEITAGKLTERLEAAEARRLELGASPIKCRRASRDADAASSPPTSPGKVLSRVRNEHKVWCEAKGRALAKQMEKAAHNREVALHVTKEKAAEANRHATSVVLAQAARANGTDAETAASRAALYEKLQNADVQRQIVLRAKGATGKGDAVSMIVIKVEGVKPRMPPADLVRRLSVVPNKLVRTAPARHAAAKAFRAATVAKAALKAAESNARRAAALGRVAAKVAEREAAAKRRDATVLSTLGINDGRKRFLVDKRRARAAAAAAKRDAAAAAVAAKGTAEATKGKEASERRAAKVRAVAKHGVVAVRAAAAKSRRDAARAAITKRGADLAARCTMAAEAKAAMLSARVLTAKKTAMRKTSDA